MSNRDMQLVRLSEGHCRHPVADESADAKKRQVALSAPRIPLCAPQAKYDILLTLCRAHMAFARWFALNFCYSALLQGRHGLHMSYGEQAA